MIQRMEEILRSFLKIIRTLYHRMHKGIDEFSVKTFNLIQQNIKPIILLAIFTSIAFGVIRTVFLNGYSVDSYQFYALSLEKWLSTGTEDYLLSEYYARIRVFYPLLIALTHHVVPIDISILACMINLTFALGSVILMRDLLKFNDYNEFEINLFTLFVVMSYNFLNYWFNILTDMTGLFFFLLSLCYTELYLKDNQRGYLVTSFIALVCSALCRETYILGVLLYLFIIRSRFKKFLCTTTVIYLAAITVLMFGGLLPFEYMIPASYMSAFESGDFIQLFAQLQIRWANVAYILEVIKGMIKVGILPACFFILILYLRRNQITLKNIKQNLIKIKQVSAWFLLFFTIYVLLYSNTSSASGLRYWLPISWIPLAYIARLTSNSGNNRTIKTATILFFILFPLSWSIGERYVNRSVFTGTGPLVSQNVYFNDMEDILSIRGYDSPYVSLTIQNNSYLSAVTLPEAYNSSDHDPSYFCNFGFVMWLNMSRGAFIRIRLCSPNLAQFGINLYPVKRDFSAGWNVRRFNRSGIDTSQEFLIYEYEVDDPFLLRYFMFSITGNVGDKIILDYLMVIAY